MDPCSILILHLAVAAEVALPPLAAPDYRTRALAQTRLIRAGMPAMLLMEIGRDSSVPEVASRCNFARWRVREDCLAKALAAVRPSDGGPWPWFALPEDYPDRVPTWGRYAGHFLPDGAPEPYAEWRQMTLWFVADRLREGADAQALRRLVDWMCGEEDRWRAGAYVNRHESYQPPYARTRAQEFGLKPR